MSKKEFLEYYIRIENNKGEVVIETTSTPKIKKIYNLIGELATVNYNYNFYVVSHLKKERERVYESERIKIYFNNDGSTSVYNDNENILICHIS